jgi:streptomycin 3"-adenylyltransferase
MEFKNYHTTSTEVKEQIDSVCDIWLKYLGDSVLGIYIHGSLVLDCFHEESSDIDILIVTSRKVSRDERLHIAKETILIDQKPCPLEMSAIWIKDLTPWKHPMPCQFHYSDYWTKTYVNLIESESESHFILDEDFEDADIASHIHVTNQSGICIYGKPIHEIFPVIPEEDFWRSISNDVDDYDFNAYNPKYFVSNILILGRILSYKKLKRVLSKYDSALWTLANVPLKYNYIINNALRVWYMGEDLIEYDKEDLKNLKQYLINEIG